MSLGRGDFFLSLLCIFLCSGAEVFSESPKDLHPNDGILVMTLSDHFLQKSLAPAVLQTHAAEIQDEFLKNIESINQQGISKSQTIRIPLIKIDPRTWEDIKNEEARKILKASIQDLSHLVLEIKFSNQISAQIQQANLEIDDPSSPRAEIPSSADAIRRFIFTAEDARPTATFENLLVEVVDQKTKERRKIDLPKNFRLPDLKLSKPLKVVASGFIDKEISPATIDAKTFKPLKVKFANVHTNLDEIKTDPALTNFLMQEIFSSGFQSTFVAQVSKMEAVKKATENLETRLTMSLKRKQSVVILIEREKDGSLNTLWKFKGPESAQLLKDLQAKNTLVLAAEAELDLSQAEQHLQHEPGMDGLYFTGEISLPEQTQVEAKLQYLKLKKTDLPQLPAIFAGFLNKFPSQTLLDLKTPIDTHIALNTQGIHLGAKGVLHFGDATLNLEKALDLSQLSEARLDSFWLQNGPLNSLTFFDFKKIEPTRFLPQSIRALRIFANSLDTQNRKDIEKFLNQEVQNQLRTAFQNLGGNSGMDLRLGDTSAKLQILDFVNSIECDWFNTGSLKAEIDTTEFVPKEYWNPLYSEPLDQGSTGIKKSKKYSPSLVQDFKGEHLDCILKGSLDLNLGQLNSPDGSISSMRLTLSPKDFRNPPKLKMRLKLKTDANGLVSAIVPERMNLAEFMENSDADFQVTPNARISVNGAKGVLVSSMRLNSAFTELTGFMAAKVLTDVTGYQIPNPTAGSMMAVEKRLYSEAEKKALETWNRSKQKVEKRVFNEMLFAFNGDLLSRYLRAQRKEAQQNLAAVGLSNNLPSPNIFKFEPSLSKGVLGEIEEKINEQADQISQANGFKPVTPAMTQIATQKILQDEVFKTSDEILKKAYEQTKLKAENLIETAVSSRKDEIEGFLLETGQKKSAELEDSLNNKLETAWQETIQTEDWQAQNKKVIRRGPLALLSDFRLPGLNSCGFIVPDTSKSDVKDLKAITAYAAIRPGLKPLETHPSDLRVDLNQEVVQGSDDIYLNISYAYINRFLSQDEFKEAGRMALQNAIVTAATRDPITKEKIRKFGFNENEFRVTHFIPRIYSYDSRAFLLVDVGMSQPAKFMEKLLPVFTGLADTPFVVAGKIMEEIPIFSEDPSDLPSLLANGRLAKTTGQLIGRALDTPVSVVGSIDTRSIRLLIPIEDEVSFQQKKEGGSSIVFKTSTLSHTSDREVGAEGVYNPATAAFIQEMRKAIGKFEYKQDLPSRFDNLPKINFRATTLYSENEVLNIKLHAETSPELNRPIEFNYPVSEKPKVTPTPAPLPNLKLVIRDGAK